MSNMTEYLGTASTGKPLRIVLLTSGTGTFVPLVDNSRVLVRLQSAGGNGTIGAAGSSGGNGGNGGTFAEFLFRVPIAGVPYVVGAAPGGLSSFWRFTASSGTYGPVNGIAGGVAGLGGNTLAGTSGSGPNGIGSASIGGAAVGGVGGGGGGGSSLFGDGGNGGPGSSGGGANGTGYGAGGGGGGGGSRPGGLGTGGFIEIWEYGA